MIFGWTNVKDKLPMHNTQILVWWPNTSPRYHGMPEAFVFRDVGGWKTSDMCGFTHYVDFYGSSYEFNNLKYMYDFFEFRPEENVPILLFRSVQYSIVEFRVLFRYGEEYFYCNKPTKQAELFLEHAANLPRHYIKRWLWVIHPINNAPSRWMLKNFCTIHIFLILFEPQARSISIIVYYNDFTSFNWGFPK